MTPKTALPLILAFASPAWAKTTGISSRWELLGVIAGRGHAAAKSVAVLKQTDGGRIVVARLGQEIAPGIKVLRIQPKGVDVGQDLLTSSETVVQGGTPSGAKAQDNHDGDEGVPYFGSDGDMGDAVPPPNVPVAPPYEPGQPPPDQHMGQAQPYPNEWPMPPSDALPPPQFDQWQDPNWNGD